MLDAEQIEHAFRELAKDIAKQVPTLTALTLTVHRDLPRENEICAWAHGGGICGMGLTVGEAVENLQDKIKAAEGDTAEEAARLRLQALTLLNKADQLEAASRE